MKAPTTIVRQTLPNSKEFSADLDRIKHASRSNNKNKIRDFFKGLQLKLQFAFTLTHPQFDVLMNLCGYFSLKKNNSKGAID